LLCGSSRSLCIAGSGDQRDLHSFPTRRSSDLRAVWERALNNWAGGTRADGETGLGVLLTALSQVPVTPGRWVLAEAACLPAAKRSEEHTSELQSRENLVCRLLLEKKKAEDHCI